jgi:hypothetical protein
MYFLSEQVPGNLGCDLELSSGANREFNASVVKIYNATMGLVRFEFFSTLKK